ncbi:hypothetical protein HELRODRAFT_172928 [Helobdella robusta]|uniref:Uncharacterized protein n=1 Tax=Helobdella robusta TaxID=6412 RepID=T1F655_HELRO|nr:hypothetical protein HELRODRAFT_172928 [Helobdella robusta]ESO03901.1 hypothetical protein HELRODRAFT_172928 [Helobdella robusta]
MLKLQHVTAAVGLFVALSAYLILHSNTFTFRLQKIINHNASIVFHFLRNPSFLVDINFNVRAVHELDLKHEGNYTEHRHYIVSEYFQHIGVMNVSAYSTSNSKELSTNIYYSTFYGLLTAEVMYKIKQIKLQNGESSGISQSAATNLNYPEIDVSKHDIIITSYSNVIQTCTLTYPWILRAFVNRTYYETNKNMLDVLETAINTELKVQEK